MSQTIECALINVGIAAFFWILGQVGTAQQLANLDNRWISAIRAGAIDSSNATEVRRVIREDIVRELPPWQKLVPYLGYGNR